MKHKRHRLILPFYASPKIKDAITVPDKRPRENGKSKARYAWILVDGSTVLCHVLSSALWLPGTTQ